MLFTTSQQLLTQRLKVLLTPSKFALIISLCTFFTTRGYLCTIQMKSYPAVWVIHIASQLSLSLSLSLFPCLSEIGNACICDRHMVGNILTLNHLCTKVLPLGSKKTCIKTLTFSFQCWWLTAQWGSLISSINFNSTLTCWFWHWSTQMT